MKTKQLHLLLIVVLLFTVSIVSCTKDKDNNPTPLPVDKSWTFKINYLIDGIKLKYDTMIYQNEAGNVYSVNKLHFYLSGFRFEKPNGTVTESDTIIYMDAKGKSSSYFQIKDLEFGNYSKVRFYLGLDSAHNISDALPNTVYNSNMAWPTMMGGGYHFMKFEGNFLSNGTSFGYAMHLGRNEYLVEINMDRSFNVMSVTDIIVLNMNLNEWFKNPHTYDFDVDGNYSMGNDSAMMKLSVNGTDIFD